MKTYLVTGAAGFIGANFIKYLLHQKYAKDDIKVIVLDALTYAGNLGTIKDDIDNNRCFFVKGDIRDHALAQRLFTENEIDYVVNFAAESHVDRSIEDPQLFLSVNILGTQNLLDAARHAWVTGKDGSGYPVWRPGKRFHQVSTDEVYGSLGPTGYFTEDTPLCPHSPYSASKTSADLFVKAYHDTYHMPVSITRCSNNYGPYHFPEKLIPLIINNILDGKSLPVYGRGENIRDWLYVEDHCKAIDLVVREGREGEVYNVGGHNEMKNIDIVRLTIRTIHDMMQENKALRRVLRKQERDAAGDISIDWINDSLITFVADRLGHDARYGIDPTKIKNELGWYPETPFAEGIVKTIRWNLEHQDWIREVTSGDYQKYYERMYSDARHQEIDILKNHLFMKKILLLGSGELGKEFVIAAKRIGLYVVACDRYDNAPAMQVADEREVFSMLDGQALNAVVEKHHPDIIVPEIEAIRTELLFDYEQQGIQVVPSARAVNYTMNRRAIRDLASRELGLRTARYFYAKTFDEFKRAADEIGFPCVVKPLMSSSGHGQSYVHNNDELQAAFKNAMEGSRGDIHEVIIEEFIDFDSEFTLLTVTQKEGPTLFCPPIGHVQKGGDYRESWQPYRLPDAALKSAQHMADRVTSALTGYGIWGVEFFLTKSGEVIFSELSPRPHDTGMVTLGHTTNLSEFELHLRAILGLPIAGIKLEHDGCSAVVLAKEDADCPPAYNLIDALKEPNTRVRIFGKPDQHVGRRMGVVLCYDECGADMDAMRDKCKRLAATVIH